MMSHGSARNAFSPPGSPPSVRDRVVSRSEDDRSAPPQEGLTGLDVHRSARRVLELSPDTIRIVPMAVLPSIDLSAVTRAMSLLESESE